MLNSNLFCTCLYNNSILKNKTMVKKQALTCHQYILIIVFFNQIQVWLFVKLFAAKTTTSHLRISSLSNLTNLLLPNLFFRYNEDVFNAGCYTIQLRIFGGCRMRQVAYIGLTIRSFSNELAFGIIHLVRTQNFQKK